MKMIAKIVALVSLIVIIMPSIMFLAGSMELDKAKPVMLAVTVVWFISAGLWMWKDDSQAL